MDINRNFLIARQCGMIDSTATRESVVELIARWLLAIASKFRKR